MKTLLLAFALAIAAHAQGFWPSAGIIPVDRRNTWQAIGIIPGPNGYISTLSTSPAPSGCRYDVFRAGGGYAFPLGQPGAVVIQCGATAEAGDYLLIVKADGVEAVYAVRVK